MILHGSMPYHRPMVWYWYGMVPFIYRQHTGTQGYLPLRTCNAGWHVLGYTMGCRMLRMKDYSMVDSSPANAFDISISAVKISVVKDECMTSTVR